MYSFIVARSDNQSRNVFEGQIIRMSVYIFVYCKNDLSIS